MGGVVKGEYGLIIQTFKKKEVNSFAVFFSKMLCSN